MTNRFRMFAFTLACLLATVAGRTSIGSSQSATPPPPPEFPQGPNRDVVVKACKECHPIAQIIKHRESRARWSQIAEKMLGEGAQMTDDEFEKVVVYLSVVLGKKIKINDASAETIADTFDIEIELATAIVKYRTEKGPFKEWKDLLKVPGVDPQRIEEQKDNLDFSTGLALSSANR
jgi:competence ComEA-like helix-hairpin-helix protein